MKKLWRGQEDQRKPRTSELFDTETLKQFNIYIIYIFTYLSTTLPVLRVVFVRASIQSNGATSLRRPRFLYCLLAASLAFTLFNVASFVWRLYGRRRVARMEPLFSAAEVV